MIIDSGLLFGPLCIYNIIYFVSLGLVVIRFYILFSNDLSLIVFYICILCYHVYRI